MADYQERLDAFAEGRKFARMSRPIRNRADGWCDACGSVLARVLFGIRDERSREVYFVGERCLQQLAERGAIVRRFSKENADEAYSARYERQDRDTATTTAAHIHAVPPTKASPVAPPVRPDRLTALLVLAAPASDIGMPPRCLSLHLDGEPASRTITLLQSWPALRQQIESLGLDRTLEQGAGDDLTTPPATSSADQPGANGALERTGSAHIQHPRSDRRPLSRTEPVSPEETS